jgi:threonine dehydrogenase-like Zn-dependent dehydrogenase
MPREQILGHEFSGTVVEVGSELKDYRKGDRVAIQPLLPPGDDYLALGRNGGVCGAQRLQHL